jgi:hypothetical protein
MNNKLILTGFLVDYDKYNRIKLMFISDYENKKSSYFDFTKEYITKKNKYYKSKNQDSYCPIVNDNYFYIKCKKKQKGIMPIDKLNHLKDTNIEEYNLIQLTNNEGIVNVDINYLVQHTVKCLVDINEYKFNLNGYLNEGYNFKLNKIVLA